MVSALGVIAKPNSTEVRLIHDCSRPHGHAVNDYITARLLKFQTLDDAIRALRPHYYMAKIDLRHAYRSVPIRPANFQATGCKWRFTGDDFNTFFLDMHLLFGAKCSPEIFLRLMQAVWRMMARRGFRDMIVCLDDFLVISATYQECKEKYDVLLALLPDLGFTISRQKLMPPTQHLALLRIKLDTLTCTTMLRSEKLKEFQTLVAQFRNKHRASKYQLQRLGLSGSV